MQFNYFSQSVFLLLFHRLKKEHIWNFTEISPKKNENKCSIINFSFISWATLLTNSSYEPHGTFLLGSTFLLHQEGPKQPQPILSLSSRGWNPLPGACSDLDIPKSTKTDENKKEEEKQKKNYLTHVRCHLSYVACPMSPLTCHLSLKPTVTATDTPLTNPPPKKKREKK